MKFSLLNCAVLATLSMASVNAFAANDLLVTTANKGQTAFSADAMLDGEAVGLQFRIKLNGANANTKVALGNCLKSLPKTHQGTCGISADKTVVTGLVYSLSNAKLPAGLFPMGSVYVSSGEKVSFEVVEFVVAGDAGRPLVSNVQDAGLK